MPPPYATIAHTTYALTVNLPTSMGLSTEQLETIARNLAREAFGVTFQDQVKVTAEADPDFGQIYQFTLSMSQGRIEADRLSDFTIKLRDELIERGDHRYPLVELIPT